MKRRRILAGVAGLATVGSAGCLSDGRSSPGGAGGDRTTEDDSTTADDDSTTTESDPTTTTDDGGPATTEDDDSTTTTDDDSTTGDDDAATTPADDLDWDPADETPFASVTVGDREGVAFPENNRPHSVAVWNAASEAREIAITIRASGDFVVEKRRRFPADGWLELTLNEPAAYELAVDVAGERVGTAEVVPDRFDCNASSTRVAVGTGGAFEATTLSTAAGCPGPAVAGRSFVRGDGDCQSADNEEEATATFRDEAVHVAGTVRTPNPCYDLALAEASIRTESGESALVLVVTTDGQREGVCVQCVGGVGYEASVDFDNEYPSVVRVVHDSMGDRRTVLETARRTDGE